MWEVLGDILVSVLQTSTFLLWPTQPLRGWQEIDPGRFLVIFPNLGHWCKFPTNNSMWTCINDQSSKKSLKNRLWIYFLSASTDWAIHIPGLRPFSYHCQSSDRSQTWDIDFLANVNMSRCDSKSRIRLFESKAECHINPNTSGLDGTPNGGVGALPRASDSAALGN